MNEFKQDNDGRWFKLISRNEVYPEITGEIPSDYDIYKHIGIQENWRELWGIEVLWYWLKGELKNTVENEKD